MLADPKRRRVIRQYSGLTYFSIEMWRRRILAKYGLAGERRKKSILKEIKT